MKKKEKQGLPKLFEQIGIKNSALFPPIVASMLGSILQLVPFWSVYKIISVLLIHTAKQEMVTGTDLYPFALIGLAGLGLGYLFTYIGGMASHRMAYRVICALRIQLAKHIGKLPLGYVTKHSIGKIKQVLDADVEQLEGFLAHQFPDLITTMVLTLGIFLVMVVKNVWLSLACLLPILIAFGIQFRMLSKLMKSGAVEKNFDALEEISASSLQYVNGMPAVKLYGQTVRSFQHFHGAILAYRDFTSKMTEMIRPGYVGFRLFILSIASFILPLGLLLFLKNPSDLSLVISFLFFLIVGPGLSVPLLKLRGFAEGMNVVGEAVKRIEEIFGEVPLPDRGEESSGQNFDLCFEQVSFSYAPSKAALHQVSFTARQGEITAIVGPSGAGKTTLAELVPRFFDVESGRISIGGVDIRDRKMDQLMDQVSFVFQDPFLFSDTIYNNIAMGKRNASKEEVFAAAKAAQCHAFISQLPKGYETKIGSDGLYLSGGEKQRISIARAILKNAPILILDEASSFADAENEYKLQQAMKALIRNKTVLLIAHRLNTIQGADQILVMEEGQVVERGKHSDLLKKGGLYARMWKAGQASSAWTIKNRKEEKACESC